MDEKKVTASKKLIGQYRKVFKSPDGRAVLYDLMKGNFMVDTTPFVAGAPDVTAKNVGQQEVIKRILFLIKIDPDQFIKLVNEQEGSHV